MLSSWLVVWFHPESILSDYDGSLGGALPFFRFSLWNASVRRIFMLLIGGLVTYL
jgi:hypothetical protein